MAQDEYVTLMASLPALGPILGAKHAPINRLRLQARMRQLRPEHFAELTSVAELLAWSRLPLLGDDAGLVRQARRVIPVLTNPTLAELARARMELRTLVAALRRRHAGKEAPQAHTDWGYGRYVRRIAANWGASDFAVARSFPWVNIARERLEKNDASGLERILLEEAWRQAERLADGHTFSYEAVALYLIRWNLLDRWTRYDVQAAAARFNELVSESLDDAAHRLTELAEPMEAVS